ncbi:MAG: GNAT family N-acetyltransferase [Bacteroidales bacterium]
MVRTAKFFPVLDQGMEYRQIYPGPGYKEDIDFIYSIYTQSFPVQERRSREQLEAETVHPKACVGIISVDKKEVGLFIYWDMDEFIYAGHFAVNPLYRGQKIGERFLSCFLKQLPCPVILEVEPPENEISCRRIAFYERLGLHLFPCDYKQPPYNKNESSVPLYLMEAPAHTVSYQVDAKLLLTQNYASIVAKLHKEVYA